MKEYTALIARVMQRGIDRETRAGRTKSIFGESISTNVSRHFPIITTRDLPYKPVLGELAAFLTGSRAVETFAHFGCNYWSPNAEAWKPGAGDVGKIYGHQWRAWNGELDQLTQLVEGIRDDPTSRRHVLTTWNPSDLGDMCLPPCHILAQFNVEEDEIDCIVYMRSVDVCLGLPSDFVLYGALLALIASEVGRKPRQLTFFFGDCHIYANHFKSALGQLGRSPTTRPMYVLDPLAGIHNFRPEQIVLAGYKPWPAMKYALNV